MKFVYSLQSAAQGLRTNKARATLTILGIVIGITAIILIMSLGQGAQNLIVSQIEGLGSKTIIIVPGRQPSGPSDVSQVFSDSLKNRDLDAMQNKNNVPHLANIMPILFGGETAAYENETYRISIFGATNLIAAMFDAYPSEGSYFTDDDVKSRADVVVIGSKVKDELFGESDALGKKIKIKGRNFRVIGVLPKKGQVNFFNFDEVAIMPYTTAQHYIFGIKYFHRIIAEADSELNVDATVQDIKLTLRDNHEITNPDKDDFFIETQASVVESLGIITNVLTLFLMAVAGISLLVGGVGIMNIMLVSVTERTKEIGLRKAIGATNSDIMGQFLIESVTLTGIGGVIGVTLGAVLSYVSAFALTRFANLDWDFYFPISAAVLGLLVSGAIGLIFGLYPAKSASEKSPIEALRYE